MWLYLISMDIFFTFIWTAERFSRSEKIFLFFLEREDFCSRRRFFSWKIFSIFGRGARRGSWRSLFGIYCEKDQGWTCGDTNGGSVDLDCVLDGSFSFWGEGNGLKRQKNSVKWYKSLQLFRDSSVWYNYGVISSLSTYLSQKLIAWAHSHWKRLMRIYLVCCKSLQRGCTVTGRDWCVFNSNTGCTVTGRDWCVLNSNTGCTVTGRDWCVLL